MTHATVLYVSAEDGELQHELSLEDILELWWPTYRLRIKDVSRYKENRERQKRRKAEILEAIESGGLVTNPGYPPDPEDPGHPPDRFGFAHDEYYERARASWTSKNRRYNEWVMAGRPRPIPTHFIHCDTFRSWLDKHGYWPLPDGCLLRGWWCHANMVRSTVGSEEPIETSAAFRGNEMQEDTPSLLEKRILAILQAIAAEGYDRLDIPPRKGKGKIKDHCLKSDPQLFSESTFDKAWSAASTSGRLGVKNKGSFTKGRG